MSETGESGRGARPRGVYYLFSEYYPPFSLLSSRDARLPGDRRCIFPCAFFILSRARLQDVTAANEGS